ncbi:MAG: SDR family oxidoreductase [Legionellales bacterium]|nr:SDR family oxidoreductase [Legionellales bacterium]
MNKNPVTPAELEKMEEVCELIVENKKSTSNIPAQQQDTQPGLEEEMCPHPISIHENYQGANKLNNKVVLITGGDSGIGRAIAYHCHAEGATIVFAYHNEHNDANETYEYIKQRGGNIAPPLDTDLSQFTECQRLVEYCIKQYGTVDILINNIAVQFYNEDITSIKPEQLSTIFATNFFSYFYLSQLCLPYLKEGNSIINSSSVTAYRGSSHLVDYSSTKGAIIAFTRSLAKQLYSRKIRVNAVAPGPVWTPLIPASFPQEAVKNFGSDTFLGRPAQPADIAPCYIFLASTESLFMTGQVLHPNGGEIINS